jgi:hypothetical protein
LLTSGLFATAESAQHSHHIGCFGAVARERLWHSWNGVVRRPVHDLHQFVANYAIVLARGCEAIFDLCAVELDEILADDLVVQPLDVARAE